MAEASVKRQIHWPGRIGLGNHDRNMGINWPNQCTQQCSKSRGVGDQNLQPVLRSEDPAHILTCAPYRMGPLRTAHSPSKRGAALLIVLAMVVLLTGVSIAYLSRTTGDRQVAQSSFHQTKVDVMAQSAMDLVIGDLQQEIANGSTAITQADGSTVYTPTSAGIHGSSAPRKRGRRAESYPDQCSLR